MSFKLGNQIVDSLVMGLGISTADVPLYVLTQLQEATLEISADPTDVTDKNGTLVYRKYTSKSMEVNATNSFMNFQIVEAISGSSAEFASDTNTIEMPVITTVDAGKTIDITGYKDGSVIVVGLGGNGAMGDRYKLGSTASATEFAIADGVLTPPTAGGEIQYLVKFIKNVKSGAKITNVSDKFPSTHELYFKALVKDLCKDELRACIIRIPKFSMSPAMSLNIAGGDSQTVDFSGTAMVDYCSSSEKILFEMYFIDEDEIGSNVPATAGAGE